MQQTREEISKIELSNKIQSFEGKYGSLFATGLKQQLYSRMKDVTLNEARELYSAAVIVAQNLRKLKQDEIHVNDQREAIRKYDNGIVDPAIHGDRSRRILALNGENPFRDQEPLPGEGFDSIHGGTQDQHQQIRSWDTPIVHLKRPNQLYRRNLERVTREVQADIGDVRKVMGDLVSGTEAPHLAIDKAKHRNHDIGFGRNNKHRVLKGAVNAAGAFTSVIDNLLKVALQGTAYKGDPTRSWHYAKGMKLYDALNAASPFNYRGSKISEHILTEDDSLEIGSGYLEQQDFEQQFGHIIDIFREEARKMGAEQEQLLNNFEKKIAGIHQKFYDNLDVQLSDVDKKHIMDGIRALLFLSPFAGIALLPGVFGMVSPLFQTDIASAMGQIVTADELGFLGDMAHGLRLDVAVKWLFDNFPIISNIFDIIGDIFQSGLGQEVIGALGPVVASPLIPLGLAGGALFFGADSKRDSMEKLSAPRKAHEQEMKAAYSELDKAYDEQCAKANQKRGETRHEAFKSAFANIKIAEFLSSVALGKDCSEEMGDNIMKLFDNIKYNFDEGGVKKSLKLSKIYADPALRRSYASDPKLFLKLMSGEANKQSRELTKSIFFQLMEKCDKEIARYIADGAYEADLTNGIDLFEGYDLDGADLLGLDSDDTFKALKMANDGLLQELRRVFLGKMNAADFTNLFSAVGKFKDPAMPEAKRREAMIEAQEGQAYFEQGFIRDRACKIMGEHALDKYSDLGRAGQALELEKEVKAYNAKIYEQHGRVDYSDIPNPSLGGGVLSSGGLSSGAGRKPALAGI